MARPAIVEQLGTHVQEEAAHVQEEADDFMSGKWSWKSIHEASSEARERGSFMRREREVAS